jgi:hypothetical protein
MILFYGTLWLLTDLSPFKLVEGNTISQSFSLKAQQVLPQ